MIVDGRGYHYAVVHRPASERPGGEWTVVGASSDRDRALTLYGTAAAYPERDVLWLDLRTGLTLGRKLGRMAWAAA